MMVENVLISPREAAIYLICSNYEKAETGEILKLHPDYMFLKFD